MTNEELLVTDAEDLSPRRILDLAAKWREIEEDLKSEAESALRIGRNLVEIRDALPYGTWMDQLREHGMSETQAWRYITYAENTAECDRALFQRAKGFSLSFAVGALEKGKRKGGGTFPAESGEVAHDPLDEGERVERLAEVAQLLKLGIEVVEAGKKAVAAESGWSEQDDARFRSRLSIAGDAVLAVADEHLEAELMRRLLPGAEAGS